MGMTILDRLLGHEAWTSRQLLLRCQSLSDEQMHREFDIDNRSLSATLGHLIGAMEFHTDRLLGRTISEAYREDTSVDGMLLRLTAVAKDFAAFATNVERQGREDEMMTNENNENLRTLGGVIAHVITHNMHHRAQAMYIMDKLGMSDIIEGDVLGWEAVDAVGDGQMEAVLAPSWQGNFTSVIDQLIQMSREWVKTPPIEPAEDDE